MKKKIKLTFLNKDEKKYLNTLNVKQQKHYIKDIYKLYNINTNNIPFKFKLIDLHTTDFNKAYLLKLYTLFEKLDQSSQEYFKYKIYFDTIINIPFGIYNTIDISNCNINDYLIRSKQILNTNIYGHQNTKNIIIQTIGQYITNPYITGNVLGLHGSPGVGKTSFVKNISSILQRPLEIINLAGAQDVSFLEGHSFTYEGSKYGKIIETLIKHNTMNPIIFFDEVDKISKTEKGIELENLLINISDITQNYNFSDKYLQELNIDLSKILFIFSFNNIESINPILLNRIFKISIDNYNIYDKTIITMEYIIPDLLSQYSFKKHDIIFNKSAVTYIINKYCKKDNGIRNIKQILNNILSKIHIIYITNNSNLININNTNISFPFTFNKISITYFL